jgi:glycosyl transferase, family 25
MNDTATPSDLPVLVITLAQAQTRRATIAARLAQLKLGCEFRPGVDGRKLDLATHPNYASMRRQLFFGRDLSGGEYGCVLAHRDIYRTMVERRIPRALVLEDDAILTDDLPAVLAALDRVSTTWDLVRFLGRPKNYRATRAIADLPGTTAQLSRPLGTPGGAYGYLLNLQAAERLLTMMGKNWLAIDTLHGVVWMTGLKTLSVTPSPVLPNDDIPSCIDSQDAHARWDKRVQIPGGWRVLYPLTRGLWKLYLNLAIKLYGLWSRPADREIRRQCRALTT